MTVITTPSVSVLYRFAKGGPCDHPGHWQKFCTTWAPVQISASLTAIFQMDVDHSLLSLLVQIILRSSDSCLDHYTHSQFSNKETGRKYLKSRYVTSTSLWKFCVLLYFLFLLSPRGISGKEEKLSDPYIFPMVGIPNMLVLNDYHSNYYFRVWYELLRAVTGESHMWSGSLYLLRGVRKLKKSCGSVLATRDLTVL